MKTPSRLKRSYGVGRGRGVRGLGATHVVRVARPSVSPPVPPSASSAPPEGLKQEEPQGVEAPAAAAAPAVPPRNGAQTAPAGAVWPPRAAESSYASSADAANLAAAATPAVPLSAEADKPAAEQEARAAESSDASSADAANLAAAAASTEPLNVKADKPADDPEPHDIRSAESVAVSADAHQAVEEGVEEEEEDDGLGTQKIYIGKGKFIKDDPKRYPDKDGLGVGGWAGGEVGLWSFRQGLDGKEPSAPPAEETDDVTPTVIRKVTPDKDLIYIGKGQFLEDDGRKYPSKDDMGLLRGITGGFAGGEVGLQQFMEKGSVEFAPDEVVQQRQQQAGLILLGASALAGIGLVIVAKETGVSILPSLQTPDVPMESIPDAVTAPASPPVAPLAVQVSWTEVLATKAKQAAAVTVGGVALFFGVKEGSVWLGRRLVVFMKETAVRVVVLSVALAVAYALLFEIK